VGGAARRRRLPLAEAAGAGVPIGPAASPPPGSAALRVLLGASEGRGAELERGLVPTSKCGRGGLRVAADRTGGVDMAARGTGTGRG